MNWFIPEWLVALSLTLFIVDVFLMTDVLSWGGVLSLSVWLTWKIDAPLKWAVLVFIGSFTLFSFLYVLLLRSIIGSFVRRVMQGNGPEEEIHTIVGKTGTIRTIDNHRFAFVDAELWPISSDCECFAIDGMAVKITKISGSEVFVVAVHKSMAAP